MSNRRLRLSELSLSSVVGKGGRRLSRSGVSHSRSSSSFCGRSVPSLDPSETTSLTLSTLSSSSSSSSSRERSSGSSQCSSSSSRRSAPVDVDDVQFVDDSNEDENPYEGMNACALEFLENGVSKSSSNHKSAPVDVDGSVYVDACEHIEGMTTIAVEYLRRGEHDLAIRTYEQVLESHVEWYGPIHPNVANVLHNAGMAHVRRAAMQSGIKQRESEEAALLKFHDAIRVIRSCDQKTHPVIAASLFQIGVIFARTDQQADAISALRESLRIRRLNPDLSNALVAKTYAYVGACHLDLGHYAEGRKAFESSLEVQRSELSRLFETSRGDVRTRDTVARTKMEIADTLFNLGSLLLAWAGRGQGVVSRVEDAEVAFAEALAIRVEILGPNHPLVAKTRVMHDAAHCDC